MKGFSAIHTKKLILQHFCPSMLRSHENFYQKSSCVFAALIGPLIYVNQKHNYITKEMCYYQKVGDEQILINSSSYF